MQLLPVTPGSCDIRICFGFRDSDHGVSFLRAVGLVQHPADVGQASAALRVFDGALAGAQALGRDDFFEDQRTAVLAAIPLDVGAGMAEAVADDFCGRTAHGAVSRGSSIGFST